MATRPVTGLLSRSVFVGKQPRLHGLGQLLTQMRPESVPPELAKIFVEVAAKRGKPDRLDTEYTCAFGQTGDGHGACLVGVGGDIETLKPGRQDQRGEMIGR